MTGRVILTNLLSNKESQKGNTLSPIRKGPAVTKNGTQVEIDEYFELRSLWIGHLKSLPEGHPQGVLVWNKDGTLAVHGCTDKMKDDLQLVLS